MFTASLAQTMAKQIAAEIQYRFGADMRLTEVGESIEIDPLELKSRASEERSRRRYSQSGVIVRGGIHFVVFSACF